MAEESTPTTVTPVAPVIDTPPPVTSVPVTTQTTPPTAHQPDNLEQKQAGETFDALSKLFDDQTPAPPTETKPPTTPVGVEDTFEKSLADLQPTIGSHPNTAKGFEELRRISREEHQKAADLQKQHQELQAKVIEYETKLKDGVIPEPVQKELEELRTMRKEIDLRMDPEFQKSYVQPIQEADQDIMRILTEAGLKEDTAKWISENGGIIRLARSQDIVDEKNKLTGQDWVENVLLSKTPTFHKNRIVSKLSTAMEITDKMSKEVTDFTTNAKERYEQHQKQLAVKFDEGKNAAIAAIGELAKPQVIAADATPEQRATIDAHNNMLKDAEAKFENYIKVAASDPKIQGEILVKATQSDMLLQMYNQAKAETESIQKRLDQVKAAGSLSQAGDKTSPTPSTLPPAKQDLLKQTDDAALNKLFKQVPQ